MPSITLVNLLAQALVLVAPGATDQQAEVLTVIQPSGAIATVEHDKTEHSHVSIQDGVTIAVSRASSPVRINGLPDSGDIVVPAQVADAMKLLKVTHNGRVFSPQRLVGKDAQGRPVGAPGLVEYPELNSSEPAAEEPEEPYQD